MLESSPISATAAQESTRPAVKGRTGARRAARSESLLFLLFVAPNLILFGIFTYWPLIYSGYLSLVRWDMISPTKTWVGLGNYTYLLSDSAFRTVLNNTFIFTGGAVGGSLFLGLLIALLLNQPLRMRDGARAVVFAPTLLSGAAISIVWVYIFDPRYGLMRQALDPFGIPSPTWLRDTTWAMIAVIIVYIWKNVGFAAVIFLAGLQTIPKDLYEAAKVDGAGAFNRFRNVTLPMLSPISFFLLVTSILNTFQAFDIIQVMTEGGPVDATNTLIYYTYEQGFVAFNAGRAAAASLILFVIMLTVTLIQLRYAERRVHYGG
ncbi:MAG: sn-glycerol 3-phosphate transport system permease protein [Thermomicrobiales bacterium]|jgi:multiple sugar transport system permease protein/sn-glycerol 3-phosphate transport system permease protein|nr:sn-glycerol 3-phosphate transport system permease protein [Thermomicrobiales bacterium]